MAIGQSRVVYRRATGDDGQRIFRLNHQVFAAELGQHAMREGGCWSTSSTPRTSISWPNAMAKSSGW